MQCRNFISNFEYQLYILLMPVNLKGDVLCGVFVSSKPAEYTNFRFMFELKYMYVSCSLHSISNNVMSIR